MLLSKFVHSVDSLGTRSYRIQHVKLHPQASMHIGTYLDPVDVEGCRGITGIGSLSITQSRPGGENKNLKVVESYHVAFVNVIST